MMKTLADKHPGVVRFRRLRRNVGKAVTHDAGFRVANGDFLVNMDADLRDQLYDSQMPVPPTNGLISYTKSHEIRRAE